VELKRERGTDLVVFDSLARFLPGSTENNAGVVTDALAPFLGLADAGLAVWLLHHPSKGEPALGQAARGSGALMASVDVILEMRHPGGDPFTRRRKLYGWSRYEDTPRQLAIELSEDGLRYERLADGSADGPDPQAVVRSVLESAAGPLTQQEIQAAWPATAARPHEGTLWRWLDRAVELGLVQRVGKGTKTEPYRYGVGGDPERQLLDDTGRLPVGRRRSDRPVHPALVLSDIQPINVGMVRSSKTFLVGSAIEPTTTGCTLLTQRL
jgi:hypothetical protein